MGRRRLSGDASRETQTELDRIAQEPGREMMRKLFSLAIALVRCPDHGLAEARHCVDRPSDRTYCPASAGPSTRRPPIPQAFVNQYCVTCHNQQLKTAGLMLDTMDTAHVATQRGDLGKGRPEDQDGHDAAERRAAARRAPSLDAFAVGARSASRSCRSAGRQSRARPRCTG